VTPDFDFNNPGVGHIDLETSEVPHGKFGVVSGWGDTGVRHYIK
jgi:hypothetical protein